MSSSLRCNSQLYAAVSAVVLARQYVRAWRTFNTAYNLQDLVGSVLRVAVFASTAKGIGVLVK